MTLTGIISISGRAGLYKVIAQGKNNVIVESLEDRKRFPAYATDRISALEDISIYTYNEDKALHEIFDVIFAKEAGKACLSHKEEEQNLLTYIEEILPDYDKERVYLSDIKKILMWYNLLHKAGELKQEKPENAEKEKKSDETDDKETKKSTKAKTTAAAKPKATAQPKAASKASSVKKAVTPKGGTSRGK